jgi:hypothetical protein
MIKGVRNTSTYPENKCKAKWHAASHERNQVSKLNIFYNRFYSEQRMTKNVVCF